MLIIMTISFLAGLTTMLGALLTLIIGFSTRRILAGILGLASGIMMGVVGLDLLPSSWQLGGMLPVLLGLGSGWLIVWLLSLGIRIRNPAAGFGASEHLVRLGYLVATGIALHDLPEGMAIAVGYAATPQLGWVIALAIGLHNVPEGMAMAAPMLLGGQPAKRILLTAGLVSLVTPLGAILGLILVQVSPGLIAYLLALAGGSMVNIVLRELWPEGVNQGPRSAALGGMMGVLLVFLLLILD